MKPKYRDAYQKGYSFGIYLCPSAEGLFHPDQDYVSEKLQAIINEHCLEDQPSLNLLFYWLQDATFARDCAAWARLARSTSSLGVRFFIAMSGSGHSIHLISPEVVRAINADEQARHGFLGLFLSEPVSVSLTETYPPQYRHWFNETNLELPLGVLDKDAFKRAGYPNVDPKRYEITCTGPFDELMRSVELHPANEAVLDPHNGINNPYEMLKLWHEVLNQWFADYISEMKDHQYIGLLGHSPGEVAIKFVAGAPGIPWVHIAENNIGSASLHYAEARGVTRTRGDLWGCMAGGVLWKYWQIHEQRRGGLHEPIKECKNYSRSEKLPGWYFWAPMTVAWANGARMFVYESKPEQLKKNPSVSQALKAFGQLVNDHPDPILPEVGCALWKGNAYWAKELPGYEEGYVCELSPFQKEVDRSPGPIYRPYQRIVT